MSIKVKSVLPIENMLLRVVFNNDIVKTYDVNQLVDTFPIYKELIDNDPLFNQVQVDCGGYAIAWNEDIDISETELWENGKVIEVQNKQSNVNFNRNGQGRTGIKVTLPLNWVKTLGVSEEDKKITLTFDGQQITMEKQVDESKG